MRLLEAQAVCFFFNDTATTEIYTLSLHDALPNYPGVLSQGTYGAKVAVPLILDLLARHKVQATFYIPGRVAERHPERVTAIVAAGHEIAHHGYTHTSPNTLTRDQEEAELVRGLDVLRGFGAEVT